jgi:mannose-6-phosphate isomerase-like protein (cupin superfamily)
MNMLEIAVINGSLTESELQLLATCKKEYELGQSSQFKIPNFDKNQELIHQLAWIQGAQHPEVSFERNELLAQEILNQLSFRRTKKLFEDVNAKVALTPTADDQSFVDSAFAKFNEELYRNVNEKLNIDFTVNRIPFPLEILDPRVVRISPKKNNELHKHAHETVFVFFSGEGTVVIDNKRVPVKPGSIVFIPRWSMHQSQNDSEEEMVFLAVADFGFTGKAFFGNYLKTVRLKANEIK